MGCKHKSPHGLTAKIGVCDDKQIQFISINGIGSENLKTKLYNSFLKKDHEENVWSYKNK